MLKRIILALVLLFAAAPAHADIYVHPSWDNLVKTLVRYGALELTDNKLLDEYAIITDCDLYRAFYSQDFKWNQVRDSMRQSIALNIAKFPNAYAYQDKIALDRYDFQNQMYYFSDRNPLQKVNAFFLYRSNGLTCGRTDGLRYMPRSFRAVLDESVSLPGLPLTQRAADALLRRMDANNNKERFVYVRFNLHINYIGKLEKNLDPMATDLLYTQRGAPSSAPILLNAQVDTIDFYEDERYTKLLYSYQP